MLGLIFEILIALHPNRGDGLSKKYDQLRRSKCPLVKELAESKHAEVISFFEDLGQGRVKLTDLADVARIVKALFCDLAVVKEIHATSYGELDEWRDESNGFISGRYMRINKSAVDRGVRLVRIFILETANDQSRAESVVRANAKLNVPVMTTLKSLIHAQDLNEVDNCLIFFNRRHEPIYCLQVLHDEGGHFVSAMLYSRSEKIQPIVDAFGRIEDSAEVSSGIK